MPRFSLLTLALVLLLVTLVLSPLFTRSNAAAAYLPGVTPGHWASYKVLYGTCQSNPSNLCQSQGGSLTNTEGADLSVVAVSGTSVTLRLITVYKVGTSSQMGVKVDVATGATNVTSLLQGPPTDYFVLAGNLQANDKIWTTNNAPTLNQTLPETVLGTPRIVNFLNYTSSSSSDAITFSSRQGFAFDQQSGVFTELTSSYNITYSGLYGGNVEVSFAMGMVDNNIWLPNFAVSSGGSMSFQTGLSGQTAITLTAQNGFSSPISLEVTSTPSGLSCTINQNTVTGHGIVTLTCSGQPGAYTVTVKATSGSTTRSTQTVVKVSSAPVSNPATNQVPGTFPMSVVCAGIGGAIIASLVAVILLRRKPTEPAIAPSPILLTDSPAPPASTHTP